MPLDAVFLSGLHMELAPQILGAKIDKVQQPERDLLLLSLRTRDGNERLLIHGGVGSARVHLTQGRFENPASPPMFCMLLRKHLVGARIAKLADNGDRLLEIQMDAHDEMGTETRRTLVIEMMGRQSNVILVDGEGIILDCMRRVDPSMSEVRPLLPGMRYRLPPKQNKPDFFETEPEERAALLRKAESGAALDSWLLHTFSGLSPLVCRELCYRAFQDASPRFLALTPEQEAAFLREMDRLDDLVQSGKLAPYLLSDEQKPKDFSFLPIEQYGDALRCEQRRSFSELLDEYYLRRDQAEAMRRKSQTLTKAIKNLRDRTARKLSMQREELRRSEDRESIRRRADLITANLYRIEKGDRVLHAEDFYEAGMPTVEIPLDPLKTPQQNAAQLYKQYQKAKTAETHLTALIAEGETSLHYLNSVLDEISRAEGEQDLAAIRAELRESGYLKREKSAKKETLRPRAPLRFVSDSGYEILVGRSNAQNDELTHRIARRTDYWLHVQKIHGSHVIIRAMDTEPDEKTLAQAASLAVYYSQSRAGGKTPVDYTMVRNVRKPSGGLPGMVLYTTYQTILAESDEALAERLRAGS